MKSKVLIIDDEPSIRKTLREFLEYESYEVDESTDGLDGLAKIKKTAYNVVILDIKMPKMDGVETLERVQILSPSTPVIMISGHADIDTAVEVVKKGAFDFISKPPDLNKFFETLRNAVDWNWERSKKTKIVKVIKGQSAYIQIKSPSEFKIPFHQYLIYFKEYVLNFKGYDLDFRTNVAEYGIRMKLVAPRSLKKIYQWLEEYLELTKNFDLDFNNLMELESNDNELGMHKLEIERQINFFKESINWIKVKSTIQEENNSIEQSNSYQVNYSKLIRENKKMKSGLSEKEYKSNLKKLLGKGKVLDVLQELISEMMERDNIVANQLLLLQSQLNNLIVESGTGKLTFEQSSQQRIKIQSHLLKIIDESEIY